MILVLGKGYIGSAFIEELERRGNYYRAVARSEVDYTNQANLLSILAGSTVTLVINCAAFITTPSVDLCENHKREALLGNVVFPVMLSDACQHANIPLLHISTGCLYTGNKGGRGYTENDPPTLTFSSGCRFYTGTKELSESVLAARPGTYCARIRLPFDDTEHPRNFLTKLRSYPKILNAMSSLSHRGDFVRACLDLWRVRAPFGIYNVTNPGWEWTQTIASLIRSDVEVVSERSPEYDCVLDTEKLMNAGIKMRPITEALIAAAEALE